MRSAATKYEYATGDAQAKALEEVQDETPEDVCFVCLDGGHLIRCACSCRMPIHKKCFLELVSRQQHATCTVCTKKYDNVRYNERTRCRLPRSTCILLLLALFNSCIFTLAILLFDNASRRGELWDATQYALAIGPLVVLVISCKVGEVIIRDARRRLGSRFAYIICVRKLLEPKIVPQHDQ